MKKHHMNIKISLILSLCLLAGLLLSGCKPKSVPESQQIPDSPVASSPTIDKEPEDTISHEPINTTNDFVCLIPSAPGEVVYSNEVASLDVSNASEGYICVKYQGTCPKVKLRITGSNQTVYTYNLIGSDYETFPLTSGSGTYSIGIYENILETKYATAMHQEIQVDITNIFGPFLYPNQYVDFDSSSQCVSKANSLCSSASGDLDRVSEIYNYVISSISYDFDKAASVPSGYTSNLDETLSTGTGICLDYAALMAAMLRSQGIPTQLEVGYAGEAYHAWISTYVDEVGWVNGIIEFDGKSWSLMDPTFAANSAESTLKKFIGNGNNYTVKYIY